LLVTILNCYPNLDKTFNDPYHPFYTRNTTKYPQANKSVNKFDIIRLAQGKQAFHFSNNKRNWVYVFLLPCSF